MGRRLYDCPAAGQRYGHHLDIRARMPNEIVEIVRDQLDNMGVKEAPYMRKMYADGIQIITLLAKLKKHGTKQEKEEIDDLLSSWDYFDKAQHYPWVYELFVHNQNTDNHILLYTKRFKFKAQLYDWEKQLKDRNNDIFFDKTGIWEEVYDLSGFSPVSFKIWNGAEIIENRKFKFAPSRTERKRKRGKRRRLFR
jgi:hypothetical protein